MKFWMMNEYKKHLVKHTGELLYSHKTVEAPFFLVLPDSGPCNIIYMYSYVTVKVLRIRSTFHINLRTDQSMSLVARASDFVSSCSVCVACRT